MRKEDRNNWSSGRVLRGGLHVTMMIRHNFLASATVLTTSSTTITSPATLINAKAPLQVTRHEPQKNSSSHVCHIQPVIWAVAMVRHDFYMGIIPKLRQAPRAPVSCWSLFLIWTPTARNFVNVTGYKVVREFSQSQTLVPSSSCINWTCIPKNQTADILKFVITHCHSVSQLLSITILNLFLTCHLLTCLKY